VVLRVQLTAHTGQTAWAEYSTFRVDGEETDFKLWVGGYTGNASDSLSAHNGYKFSTVDRNNDEAPKCCPCAPAYGGGWWFYRCRPFSSSSFSSFSSPSSSFSSTSSSSAQSLSLLTLPLLTLLLASCFESNLNGEYFAAEEDNGYYRGIVWELWLGDYSLAAAELLVRPLALSPGPSSPPATIPDP
jgi:hypothetical protein